MHVHEIYVNILTVFAVFDASNYNRGVPSASLCASSEHACSALWLVRFFVRAVEAIRWQCCVPQGVFQTACQLQDPSHSIPCRRVRQTDHWVSLYRECSEQQTTRPAAYLLTANSAPCGDGQNACLCTELGVLCAPGRLTLQLIM